ncbi:MAG: NUDIX domain-containing protein [bacterium]
MATEQILVVPRSVLSDILPFRGFMPLGKDRLETWLEARQFRPRDEMETDPGFKQIIPYTIVRHADHVFRYWRTKRAGENRLHHLYSIGIGGHINNRDMNLFTSPGELMNEAAARELKEEVEVDSLARFEPVGFINDDESEVGRVHFGVVYEAWVESRNARIRETALARGEWRPVSELQDGVEYETWSRFVIEEYLIKA